MRFSVFLNEKTHHLIDWKRVGNLFLSNHHYSLKELMERSFIVTSTAVVGFLSWNNSEKGGIGSVVWGASMGFFISHSIVMSHLAYKRLKTRWACLDIIQTIQSKFQEHPQSKLINKAIYHIMIQADSKSASSAVWGKRKRLLTRLSDYLDARNLEALLDTPELIQLLDENKQCNSHLSYN